MTIFRATFPLFYFYIYLLRFFSLHFHSRSFPFVSGQHHMWFSIMSYISIFDLVHFTWDWFWFQYNLCNFKKKPDPLLLLYHKMFLSFLFTLCYKISKLISSKSVHYEREYKFLNSAYPYFSTILYLCFCHICILKDTYLFLNFFMQIPLYALLLNFRY